MSERIKRNAIFLQQLGSSSQTIRNETINNATQDNIDALTELMINLLNGNISISSETKTLLSKHKTLLRTLSKKTVSGDVKKKSLFKKTKLIPIILTPILSALGSVLGRILSTELNL